ncbi:CDF family Co(II)/Ni(II) efflux transporter DmeF [uncultured Gammaproteobacteria bacterium]
MTIESLAFARHSHAFLGESHRRNERRTWLVIGLTTAMMVAEIIAGTVYNSMALVADGWHMSTHAGALTIAALAYGYARRHAEDPRFTFGPAKLGDLAGFASAVILGVIALLIAVEAGGRLLVPVKISFDEAIAVAVLGLLVNLASIWLLGDDHEAGHDHGHHEHHNHGHHGHEHRDHGHGHRDNNLRAAYLHVVADALTSVTAIAGLVTGRLFGWVWMDAVMALLGTLVIAAWSIGLIRDSGAVLLDVAADPALARAVRARLEQNGDHLTDLHLWRLGPRHHGLIVSLVSGQPLPPSDYKARLASLEGLSHVTIEVQPFLEKS